MITPPPPHPTPPASPTTKPETQNTPTPPPATLPPSLRTHPISFSTHPHPFSLTQIHQGLAKDDETLSQLQTPPATTEIPIQSSNALIPITLHLPQSTAAIKIQSAYRAHLIRTHFKTIVAVHSEADEFQRLIQRQETVDSVRTSKREKLRMNESLMWLLLKLDSDLAVREARRKVSRRIVDAIVSEDVDGLWGGRDGGFGRNWDDVLAEMKDEACRDKRWEEMERFCAQYMGFF
nr:BAG family molecular chaperone regulator 5, mitochondrial-like [Malus domestica]